ncbi:MAG: lamin tail domain-containing protein [Myxococcota bacterium]
MLLSLVLACVSPSPEPSVGPPTPVDPPVPVEPGTPDPLTVLADVPDVPPDPVDPVDPVDPTAVTGFAPVATGFQAQHPPMGTVSTVTPDGVAYAGTGWELVLTPRTIGREGSAQPIGGTPALVGDRVVMGADPVVWFAHDTAGLEFGLDVATRPAGTGLLEVRFDYAGLGDPWSLGTDLSWDTGTHLVHIDGLVVRDSTGAELPSALRQACGYDPVLEESFGPCQLAIEVDDSSAVYPIVIDPTVRTEPPPVFTGLLAVADLSPGDLVITELMVNPVVVNDEFGEYIEITNTTGDTVELDGLAIWDDSTNYFLIPDVDLSVGPGGTVVLGRSANPAANGGVPVDLAMGTSIQLSNTLESTNPDEVVIGIRATSAACGPSNPCTEIDRVVMDETWNHFLVSSGAPFVPEGAAFSLDPSQIGSDNNVRSAWCDALSVFGSGQFGTPNASNDDCAFSLPFEYTWNLTAGGTLSECTAVNLAFGTTMTTDNGGEGTYIRYTNASGQLLQWNYGASLGTVYSGTRAFGASTWTFGNMTFTSPLVDDGSWVSPCASGDTGDTGVGGGGTLLITQYLHGSGNNKYLEIQNLTGAPADLTGCRVQIYFNGNTTPLQEIFLGTGTLAANELFSMCHSSAALTIGAPPCDITSGGLAFNGDDAIELICDTTTIDVIGRIGEDPGNFWGTSPLDTQSSNLQRDCAITSGDANGFDAFDPADEWSNDTNNDASDIGLRTCP